MKFSYSVILPILSSLASQASAACSEVDGNYYCDQTDAVVYEGIGYSGSYQEVTAMDTSSCSCSQSETSFSGTLSPLDEELSVHFRGPLKLLQFGAYYPSSSVPASKKRKLAKRDAEEDCTTTRHVHHQHKRAAAIEVVEVTATVYVNGQGDIVGGTQESTAATASAVSSAAEAATTTSTEAEATVTTSAAAITSSSTTELSSSSSSSSSSSAAATTSSSSSSGDGWERYSYFSPGSTDNLVFLNTLGGSGSGVWDSCFGNSISYCASNGVDAASSAQALEEVTVDSDVEYMIMSGVSCDDTSVGDCGFYRSGIPAYHGFSGSSKMFVFEFEMPTATDSVTNNHDMPAIWLLNAKIPRTLQYGNSECSCWSTGCGELDLFEILSEGSDQLISHLHDGQGDNGSSSGGAGSSDYFTRPTTSSMKAAVIFDNGNAFIVQLDDSTDFSSDIDASTVSDWLSTSASVANFV